MDFQKEKEAFEDCYKTSRDYKFYVKHEMSEKQIFEFKNDKYVVDCVNGGWKIWRAAKAQAVPEGFVLVPKEIPKSFDEGLYFYSNSISVVNEHSDGFIPMSDIDHSEIWKLVIEAQEQTHD